MHVGFKTVGVVKLIMQTKVKLQETIKALPDYVILVTSVHMLSLAVISGCSFKGITVIMYCMYVCVRVVSYHCLRRGRVCQKK